MYLAHASPLLVNTCWGRRDTGGLGRGCQEPERSRTVLRQLTHPQRIGSETKISRGKLSRSWVESPPPHPVHPSKGQILKREGWGTSTSAEARRKRATVSPCHNRSAFLILRLLLLGYYSVLRLVCSASQLAHLGEGTEDCSSCRSGPFLSGAEAHYTFLARPGGPSQPPRPAPPAGRPAQQSERSTRDSAPALGP